MSGVTQITVASADGEQRLDRWFKRRFPALGHGRLEKLLRTGQIRVDGKRAKASDRLDVGQIVRIPPLGDLDADKDKHGAADKPTVKKSPAAPAARDSRMLQEAVL